MLCLFCVAGAQESEPAEAAALSEGELDQLLAPIALYPDDLLAQVLMASTYPLEVVQARRWVEENELEGDAMAEALEIKNWDPSVKSLVNFPEVLEAMDGKLDWTQKLGNAFLAQQEDVMASVQRLRKLAKDEGNLEDTEQQKIETEGDTIVIVPADPEVVYVPIYNTTVVYGTWRYPAWPPYYWYPPRYPRPTLYGFTAGVAVGFAWGYAWGRCSWGRSSHVHVDINRNININRNIDRERYKRNFERGTGGALRGGQGQWQHNPQHRRGVAYGDRATAQRFNRGPAEGARSRDAYRGRVQPQQQPSRATPRPTPTRQPASGNRAGPTPRPSPGDRAAPSPRPSQGTRQARPQPSRQPAFSGYDSRGAAQRSSSRGAASRSNAAARGGAARGGGGRR